MSNQRLSTPEASKALGIPVHVITYWLGQIPYPAEQDEQGQWRLTPEAMAVLQTVKDLKEQNRGMDTIRRHVKELQDTPPPAQRPLAPPPPGQPPAGAHREGPPPAPPRREGPPPNQQRPQPASSSALPPGQVAPQGQPVPGGGQPPPGSPTQVRRPAPGNRKGPPPQQRPEGQRVEGQRPAGQHAPVPVSGPQGPANAGSLPMANVPPGMHHDIACHVARAVSDAVRHETVLAQRYAQAAHQIGKLEAENEHLRGMLNAAQAKHGREQEEARARITALEAQATPKKKTSWWAWLTLCTLL